MQKFIWLGLGMLLGSMVLFSWGAKPQATHAQYGDDVHGYFSPCQYGTQGTVSTWHGANMDGQPPYDPSRRTYDFRCQDKLIYAPHAGVVWGVTPRFGGVILIQDLEHNACMVFLGMHGTAVEPNQAVEIGTYLGFYGHAFHLSVIDGDCIDTNWYDAASRDRERPVQWVELGEDIIAPDIVKTDPLTFVSQNSGGRLQSQLRVMTKLGFGFKQ